MVRNLPNGSRVIVVVKFGNTNYYSRLKKGTADLLGLKAVDDTALGKNKAEIRGNKAKSHSYTLVLKNKTKVGGADVYTVAFPVNAKVGKATFRKWAKTQGNVVGMITPWGISNYWGDVPERDKNLGQQVGDAIGNALGGLANQFGDKVSDAAGQLGDAALDAVVNKVTGGLLKL